MQHVCGCVCRCDSCCLMSEVRDFTHYRHSRGTHGKLSGSTFRLLCGCVCSKCGLHLLCLNLFCVCYSAQCMCVYIRVCMWVCALRLMFLFFCLPSISLQLGSLPFFSVPSLPPCSSSSLRWDEKAAADRRRSRCVCVCVHACASLGDYLPLQRMSLQVRLGSKRSFAVDVN